MEEDEIQAQASCKFPRVGNGMSGQYQEEEEEGGDQVRRRSALVVGGGGSDASTNHFQSSSWHHSSRIIRVSRASGGKDRHSKVMTSKGLRDRRVRLSVTTAIQFYDLQDRLGYDQPSKAVEWLIKAASEAISELPSLTNPFPETPKQPSDEKRPTSGQRGGQQQQGFDDADGDTSYHQNQNLSLSKSGCSSNSETSKGSGLSLSRSEIRVKARERARERATKEKVKEKDSKEKKKEKESTESGIAAQHHQHQSHGHHHNHNHMSHTASFTELLTGGIGSTVTVNPTTSPNGSSVHQIHESHHEANLFNKGRQQQQQQHWSQTVTPMDYFSTGLLVGHSSSSRTQQFQLGHAALPISPFSGENVNHSEQLQHFSFMPDHLNSMPSVVTSNSSASASASHQPSGGDNNYNLNFSISSSGLAGYNRGTLQSNSPSSSSFLPHLQRFQPLVDGSSNLPNFFIGAPAAPSSAAPPTTMDSNNHHHHLQFSPVFDGRLQLCYGDGTRHSDHKGKGKN